MCGKNFCLNERARRSLKAVASPVSNESWKAGLYELAAKQGNADASVELGDMYYYGRGDAAREGDEAKRLARAVARDSPA